MSAGGIKSLATVATGCFVLVAVSLGQHQHDPPPLPVADPALKPALLLLREGKAEEARQQIRALLTAKPNDAELHYQMARSYLMDFHATEDTPKVRATSVIGRPHR